MIPASCAVASASPFGSESSRWAVPGDIATSARATARRRETGLPPTSTMRTAPPASTWLSSFLPAIARIVCLAARAGRRPLQVVQLRLDPRRDVVRADVVTDAGQPRAPLVAGHRERTMKRLCLAFHIERVDGECPLSELLVRARVLGEDEHAVAIVDERRLFRD